MGAGARIPWPTQAPLRAGRGLSDPRGMGDKGVSMRTLLLCLLLCSACANHRYFAPRENQNGTGPGGYPAAVYALQAEGVLGEVRLWSRGSSKNDSDPPAIELHLGFEVENTGSTPLELDLGVLRLDELWIDTAPQGPLRPAWISGDAVAQPGATARFDAWFQPPGARSARTIDAFQVRFQVRSGERVVLLQVTPFEPWRPPDPYDDPWYWGGGWGFGGGWFVGHHCHD